MEAFTTFSYFILGRHRHYSIFPNTMKAWEDLKSKHEGTVITEASSQLVQILCELLVRVQIVSMSIIISSSRWLLAIFLIIRPIFFFADSSTIEGFDGVTNRSSTVFLSGALIIPGIVVEKHTGRVEVV